MYTIANVVYGVPLHDYNETEWSAELSELVKSKGGGVISRYSGYGDDPTAFGVLLSELSCTGDYINISDIKLMPSADEENSFSDMFNELTMELQEELTTTYGKPRAFILWSTS